MKCWKSAFNEQGSSLIVVALQVAVNICSNSGGAKEKGKTSWNSVHHKNWGPPPLNPNVFFFFQSHLTYDQTQGSSVVFLTL